jgi:hypothetical protein
VKITRSMQDRLPPIFRKEPNGDIVIIGYKRLARSRKKGTMKLAKPLLYLKAADVPQLEKTKPSEASPDANPRNESHD